MVAHLCAFAGHVFPFAHIIAPLIVWLAKRETSPFVDAQGKEAVNAQVSVTIYAFLAVPFALVAIGVPVFAVLLLLHALPLAIPALPISIGLGIAALFAVIYVTNFILVIVAAIAANEGRAYRYPFILRLLR